MKTVRNQSKNGAPVSSKAPGKLRSYLQVVRVDHWFKNVFTLIGSIIFIAYTEDRFSSNQIIKILLACGLSCLVSSINYVVNEILDASYDSWHPRKKHRPIPSGRVARRSLNIIMISLFMIAYLVAFTQFSLRFSMILILFLIFGLLYNVRPIRAKEIPYLDVIVESANNPIRIALGWYALADPSFTLPLSAVFFFWVFGAFLMTAKRLAEMRFLGDQALPYRITFQYYTEKSLHKLMLFYAVSCVFIYLHIIFRVFEYQHHYLLGLLFLIFFFIWCLRLVMEEDSILKEPESLLRRPGFALFCLFGLVMVLILFLI